MNFYYSMDFTTGCTVGLEFIDMPTFDLDSDLDEDIFEVKTMLFIHLFIFKIGVGIW